MKTLTRLIVILSIFFLAACGDPKLDGSTDDSLKSSAVTVSRSLPEGGEIDQAIFFSSIEVVIATKTLEFHALAKDQLEPAESQALLRKHMHGKTANQIFAEAQQIVRDPNFQIRNSELGRMMELKSIKLKAYSMGRLFDEEQARELAELEQKYKD